MAGRPITVSQLNSYIKRVLGTDPVLYNISVVGEISGFKRHTSGHVYFTLKDQNSRINCFLSSYNLGAVDFMPEDGMQVILLGQISVYEPGGYYNINVSKMEMAGSGDLAAAFQKLKEKLEKEGLFLEKYKKPLPFFPMKVAVITSETGAAIKDILSIIQNRNNICDILICPCLVQGEHAPADIRRAIENVNTLFPETEVIILGRGGGSIEDLWAFNEEIVARAIFASKIPVISAVGHETDFTISDMVADKRAETPTAAAVMAVPDVAELKASVSRYKSILDNSMNSIIANHSLRMKSYDIHSLYSILQGRISLLGMEVERLKLQSKRDVDDRLSGSQMRIDELYNALDIKHRLDLYGMKTENLIIALHERTESCLNSKNRRVLAAGESLKDLSPYAIMERGYAAVLDKLGKAVNTVKMVEPEDTLTIVFKDGRAAAKVSSIKEN